MELQQRPVKCQKCRFHLFQYSDVLDSHGNGLISRCPPEVSQSPPSCSTGVWYVPEEKLPSWMKANVDSGEWVKGKMNCPRCQARIGSYNFVSGMKCTCGSHVLPPIHIVKSKVDVILPLPLHLNSNTVQQQLIT